MPLVQRDSKNNDALVSAALLAAVPASLPLCALSFCCDLPVVRAVGLLLVPTTALVWVISTIRALHRRQLQYWNLESTYVLPAFGGAAFVIVTIAGFFHTNDGRQIFLDASAIVSLGGVIWCAWYNWRKTQSILLATSVTVFQIIVTCVIIAALLLRMNRTGDRDSD